MATKKKLLQVSGGGEDYWIATLESSGRNMIGFTNAIDSNGNVIVVGYSDYLANVTYNVCIVAKYNSSGDILWQKYLGDSQNFDDRFYGVAVDSSDNIICVGYTERYGFFTGSETAFIVKFNSSGVIQWQRTLGNSYNNIFYRVAVDASDNIIASGKCNFGGNDQNLLAKYNASGVLQWQKQFGATNIELGYNLLVSQSGDIYQASRIQGTGAGSYDAMLIKWNSNGFEQWTRGLGDSSADYLYSIDEDSSGDIVVVGQTQSTATSYDGLVAKYNTSGTLQWSKTVAGSSTQFLFGVTIDSSDNIYAVGYTYISNYLILIIKLDSSGNVVWKKTLGTSGFLDTGYDIQLDSKQNLVISGRLDPSVYHGLVAKLPNDGSGDGTYGSIVYQDDTSVTVSSITLTETVINLTESNAGLSDRAPSISSGTATLTDTLYTVTP